MARVLLHDAVMTLPSLHEPTIVVPVDFDDPSKHAVSLAVSFAHALGGRVVLVHVVPPMSFPEGTRLLPTDAADPVDLGEYVSRRAKRMLDDHFVSLLVSGLEVRKEVRTGRVVETVLRVLDECGAGLVVVGTHGRTGASRLVLGSVAEGLVRRSHVPVLVARQPEEDVLRRDSSVAGVFVAGGAVAGAATGAVGGPVGAVVGGALGAIVGGIAGGVAAREDARATARDRALDDAIGVTDGTLGTSPANKQPSAEILREAEEKESS